MAAAATSRSSSAMAIANRENQSIKLPDRSHSSRSTTKFIRSTRRDLFELASDVSHKWQFSEGMIHQKGVHGLALRVVKPCTIDVQRLS
jgi:hypothetical protein